VTFEHGYSLLLLIAISLLRSPCQLFTFVLNQRIKTTIRFQQRVFRRAATTAVFAKERNLQATVIPAQAGMTVLRS
jgi:hypothetical protein